MADFDEEILRQPGGALARRERQGLRYFLERALTRERLKKGVLRWLTYIAPAAGAAVAVVSLYGTFFGGGR